MLSLQLALVSETKKCDLKSLLKVSAALQKQAMRDFAPIWEVKASVDAFADLEDVPLGYWPIIVVADVPDAAGVHLDEDGQPYALVEYGPSWSLTASHECLEMLADPYGERLIAGASPKKGQGRVEFLVEVCDPSEDEQFSYHVNSVLVSDFYTPHFFDPVKSSGARYSYTGALHTPRDIVAGGYLSWHDPIGNHWWQKTWFSGSKPAFRNLGVFAQSSQSTRSWIDERTPNTRRLSTIRAGVAQDTKAMLAAATAAQLPGGGSKAQGWRRQIRELSKRKSVPMVK